MWSNAKGMSSQSVPAADWSEQDEVVRQEEGNQKHTDGETCSKDSPYSKWYGQW